MIDAPERRYSEIILAALTRRLARWKNPDEGPDQASQKEQMMIATLVLFYEASAVGHTTRWSRRSKVPRRYRGMDGLRSKAYVIDPERNEFGGFTIWESREQMTRVQGHGRMAALVRERYGITPTIRAFENTVDG